MRLVLERGLLSNLNGFNPASDLLSASAMLPLDRWIVFRAGELQQQLADAYTQYQFHLVYQKVHHFCASELGGFYLDIIKDRQYTAGTESIARRSAQTAMFHIIQALVRWIAPILSFTADEIWEHLPGTQSRSVFLETWYEPIATVEPDTALDDAFWTQMLVIRRAVNGALEAARSDGLIKGSLDAEVVLYASETLRSVLERLGDELRFVLITSEAKVQPMVDLPEPLYATELAELKVWVTTSSHEKCERCWHRRADVGTHAEHPTVCGRCIDNIEGDGEQRLYA